MKIILKFHKDCYITPLKEKSIEYVMASKTQYGKYPIANIINFSWLFFTFWIRKQVVIDMEELGFWVEESTGHQPPDC